jgi:HemY protein
VHAAWEPVCENCGAFDTLDWRTPPHDADPGIVDSAMLPLIIGPAEPPPPEPEPEPTPAPAPQPVPPAAALRRERTEVMDAELANAADRARVAGAGS